MTTPDERTRSLRWTREFLEHLAVDARIEPRFQERAQKILETYPTAAAITARAAMDDGWLAPDPSSDADLAS